MGVLRLCASELHAGMPENLIEWRHGCSACRRQRAEEGKRYRDGLANAPSPRPVYRVFTRGRRQRGVPGEKLPTLVSGQTASYLHEIVQRGLDQDERMSPVKLAECKGTVLLTVTVR